MVVRLLGRMKPGRDVRRAQAAATAAGAAK